MKLSHEPLNHGPIEAFTGLRAFLALWVVTRHVFHLYDGQAFFPLGVSTALFDRGYLGVDGFFILSGFILSYNYAGQRLNYRGFLAARFARIYPVHVVCIAILFATLLIRQMLKHQVLIGVGGHSTSELVRHVLLLQAWRLHPDTSWNDVSWSVSAEWFAYVMFPVFVALAGARSSIWALVKLAVPMALLVLLSHACDDQLSRPGDLSRVIPEFYAGVLLHTLRTKVTRMPRLSGLAGLACVGTGLAVAHDPIVVFGLGWLIFSLSFRTDWLTYGLSLSPVRYAGEISYSGYMIQRFVQNGWASLRHAHASLAALSSATQFALFLVTLVALASAMYHVAEVPLRRQLRQRLSGTSNRLRSDMAM